MYQDNHYSQLNRTIFKTSTSQFYKPRLKSEFSTVGQKKLRPTRWLVQYLATRWHQWLNHTVVKSCHVTVHNISGLSRINRSVRTITCYVDLALVAQTRISKPHLIYTQNKCTEQMLRNSSRTTFIVLNDSR